MRDSDRAATRDGNPASRSASPPVASANAANDGGGGGDDSDAVPPVRNGESVENVLVQKINVLTTDMAYLFTHLLRKDTRERGEGSHYADGHGSRGGGVDKDVRQQGDHDRGAESARSERERDEAARPPRSWSCVRDGEDDRSGERYARERERGEGSYYAGDHGSRGGGGDKDARQHGDRDRGVESARSERERDGAARQPRLRSRGRDGEDDRSGERYARSASVAREATTLTTMAAAAVAVTTTRNTAARRRTGATVTSTTGFDTRAIRQRTMTKVAGACPPPPHNIANTTVLGSNTGASIRDQLWFH